MPTFDNITFVRSEESGLVALKCDMIYKGNAKDGAYLDILVDSSRQIKAKITDINAEVSRLVEICGLLNEIFSVWVVVRTLVCTRSHMFHFLFSLLAFFLLL